MPERSEIDSRRGALRRSAGAFGGISGNKLSRKALGPSDSAFSGSSCTSTKTPEMPVATAADGQRLDELRLASRYAARAAGKLDAVGGIENHRPSGLRHDPQAAHIDDQIVVSERRSALRQDHLAVTGRSHFIRRVMDVVRADELAFLDVHDLAGTAGFEQQIGLAAEERRDLEDVGHFGGGRGLGGFVDIGQDGKSALPQAAQNLQPFARRRGRGSP